MVVTACQLDGSQQFSIQLKPDSNFHTALVDTAPNLSSVPEAYHNFVQAKTCWKRTKCC